MSNRTNVILEICQRNFDPSRPALQCHSRSWNRHGSIGYLWLAISVA